MNEYMATYLDGSKATTLSHYGRKGQKWYHRLYQNPDGSLTPLGRIHYGVGQARKKATEGAKNVSKKAVAGAKTAIKNAPKKAKETYTELRKERKAAKIANKKRKFELAEQRRQEKIENAKRKLIEKQSKKTLAEIADELQKERIAERQRQVDLLIEQRSRIKMEAELKEQARALKKEMKTLRKDAEKEARKQADKKNSRKDIRAMTDAEIDARISRLKKETQLAVAEAERNMPAGVKMIKDEMVKQGVQAVGQLTRDAVTNWAKKNLSGEETAGVEALTDRVRKELAYRKAKDEYADYTRDRETKTKTRDRDAADAELAKAVTRMDNLRKIEDAKTKMRTRSEDEYDTEISKQAQRLETLNRIREATKKASGAESASSRKERAETYVKEAAVRKEQERRAENYRKNNMPISEIAKRMGLTESQVKDLLYK